MNKSIDIVFLLSCMLFLDPTCRAEVPKSTTVLEAIKTVCPASIPEPLIEAKGDLNGDGIPDVAALAICDVTEDGAPRDQVLLILFGQRDGGYRPAHRSQRWGYHVRSEMELSIRGKSVVLTEHCAYDCLPVSWNNRFSFVMRQDRFVLAGEDYVRTSVSGTNSQNEDQSGKSINHLAKKAVVWTRSSKRGYSEGRLSMKWMAPIELTDFNFESCDEHRLCRHEP